MNMNVTKQKRGRQALSRRPRQPQVDKNIMKEGVYSNPRIIHATLLLVGCNVQVTVKNGGVYEGIFKTVSPSSQIVLEMAHKVDTQTPAPDKIPTKQMLINSIIFNLSDVVTISAASVEMDYANKETFVEPPVAKYNNGGSSVEKELQPWESPEGCLDAPLEALDKNVTTTSSANGWDAEDMFHINAEKYDVKSSYDPNLSQYTTPLVKKDTKEYREREARALRLAAEIEKTEDYARRMALENGDQDDEEMAFSAVHRAGSNETNNNTGTSGKYVPPMLRKNQNQGRPTRINTSGSVVAGNGGTPSPQGQSPSPQQAPSPNQLPVSSTTGAPLNPPAPTARPAQPTGQGPVAVSVSVSSAETITEETPDNKNKEERRPSDVQERGKVPDRTAAGHPGQPQPNPGPADTRKPKNARDKLQELYEFNKQFKLKDNESKDSKSTTAGSAPAPAAGPNPSLSGPPAGGTLPSQAGSDQGPPPPSHLPTPSAALQAGPQPDKPSPTTATASLATVTDKEEDKKDSNEDKDKVSAKSVLNPFAKEFVPSSKPAPRQQPLPISTPPRAATQSPVIMPAVQTVPSLYHQPYILQSAAPPALIPQNPQPQRHKRVVVSAQTQPRPGPDLTAAAATGQPLLQTPLASQNPQYAVQFPTTMMANAPAQGPLPQVFPQQSIVQVAPGASPRMITPQLVQGASTPTDQVNFPQNQQPQAMFVSPQGPHNMTTMQSYIGGPPPTAGAAGSSQQAPPPTHGMPTHMAPHHHVTPPHSQGGASGSHPTPSPVPQPGTATHQQHPQPPPPSSGTPQPSVMFPTGQANAPPPTGGTHPPLQPSPHTPTSPQSIYPPQYTSNPYSYQSQSYSIQPPVAYSTSTHQHTTVTHAHHHQHSHRPQSYVMMTAQHASATPHTTAINAQMQHQVAAAAAAAAATGGAPPQAPNQYTLNHNTAAQGHPQGHPLQAPQLHGQAGPGHPISQFVQHQQIVSQAPQYHHNQ